MRFIADTPRRSCTYQTLGPALRQKYFKDAVVSRSTLQPYNMVGKYLLIYNALDYIQPRRYIYTQLYATFCTVCTYPLIYLASTCARMKLNAKRRHSTWESHRSGIDDVFPCTLRIAVLVFTNPAPRQFESEGELAGVLVVFIHTVSYLHTSAST